MAAPCVSWVTMPAKKFSLFWWVIWVSLGTALGFILPSIATLVSVADGRDATGQFVLAVIGGALQGAILGFAQAFALRRTVAALPMLGWILVTTVGAILAWSFGMIPGSFLALASGTPLGIAELIVFGLLAVLVLPTAQWFILRGTKLGKIGRVWRWIPITAVAWIAGIVWLLLASLLVQDSTDLVHLIALYTVAGLLMVLTVSFITGLGMRWMLGGAPVRKKSTSLRRSFPSRKTPVPSRTA